MKVKELIEKLKEYPEDMEVLYSNAIHMGYHVGGLENSKVVNDVNNKEVLLIGDWD